MEAFLGISIDKLILAVNQTIYMVSISLFFGAVMGFPMAVLLVVTRKDGICPNHVVNSILNGMINVVRSVPFVILLVFIMPLTKFIVHTRIGTNASIVPLVFYIGPYLARLIENSLLEVDHGKIEAAQAMGATNFQIIRYFMLPEAMGSILVSLTTGTIGLVGATAMAGTIGGGGVGDLALTYGYQRFNQNLMLVTVIILILFVQLIQFLGYRISAIVKHQK